MDTPVEILENSATNKQVSLTSGKLFSELPTSLMPDIAEHLENFFTQVMLTKFKLAHIIASEPLDLSDWAKEKAALFTENKTLIQKLINQFTREVKPGVLEKFTEVDQFVNNFQSSYSPLVDELNLLKENIKQQTAEISDYKAILCGYLDIIKRFKHTQVDKDEVILSTFMNELRKIYDELKRVESELLGHDANKKNKLESIEKQLNAIDSELDKIDIKKLHSISIGEKSTLTVSRLGQIDDQQQQTSQNMDATKHQLDRYKRKLKELGEFDKPVKDLVLFNIMIKRCSDNIPKLSDAIKAISDFWINLEKNINDLLKFIADNRCNDHAIDYVLNYLEEAEEDFEFLRKTTNHFSSNTSIKVSYSTGKNNFLALNFLLKDPK